MDHTGHLLGWHGFRDEEGDSGDMTLGRQCIQELLIARRAENAFSQASRPRLPNSSPDGLDQAGRPVLARHVREQLVDHPLQQLKLRPAPPPGEEGRGYLRPVHERTVHMVQHVMEHTQIHSHHLRNPQNVLPIGKRKNQKKSNLELISRMPALPWSYPRTHQSIHEKPERERIRKTPRSSTNAIRYL